MFRTDRYLHILCKRNLFIYLCHCLGIREAFQSGDHEPWVFRGGLTADLLRLMPVDTGNDLFLYQYPDHPTNLVYKMRPYTSQVGTMVLPGAFDNLVNIGRDLLDCLNTDPKLTASGKVPSPLVHYFRLFSIKDYFFTPIYISFVFYDNVINVSSPHKIGYDIMLIFFY